jgi:glycosyltransferase involved in cell wall biosynthesis
VIVGVDDASPDRSGDVFGACASRLGLTHVLVRHPVNRGQGPAVLTGLTAVEAAHYVVMDADLEDEPENIPALLRPFDEGKHDLVFADRGTRLKRRLSSELFKTFLVRAAGRRLPTTIGLFSAMSRSLRDRVVARASLDDYILVWLLVLARNVLLVPCPPRPTNTARASSYTLAKKLRAAARAMRTLWRVRGAGRDRSANE